MFQKVLRYTGRHRKTTYASILVLVARRGHERAALFLPLPPAETPADGGAVLTLEETLFNAGAMALCMVLYGFSMWRGWLCLIAPPIILWKTSGSISRASWKSSPWARSRRRALESGRRCSLTTLRAWNCCWPTPCGRAVQSGGAGGGICGHVPHGLEAGSAFPLLPFRWACWLWA